MIALKSLLAPLTRAEVTEVQLTTGRAPAARAQGVLEDITPAPLSTDVILQLLVAAGGSRQVDVLGPRPTNWSTRIDGVGPVAVAALMLGDDVHATFTLRRREGAAGARESDAGAAPSSNSRLDRPSPVIPEPSSRQPARDLPGAKPVRRHSARIQAATAKAASRRQTVPDRPSPVIPEPSPTFGAPGPQAALRPEHSNRETVRDQPKVTAEPPATLPTSALHFDDRGSARQADPPRSPLRATLDDLPFDLELDDRFAAPPPPPTEVDRAPATKLAAGPPASTPSTLVPPPSPFAVESVVSPRRGEPRSRAVEGPPPHGPLFADLLRAAREAGASDLHVVAARPPLLRVAGELVARGEPLDPTVVEPMIVGRIPPRLMASFEREGSCDFALEERGLGRFRVNVTRQRTGIKASLRPIPAQIPTLAALGLPEAIGAATRHHQGLIVITGPTGHGKTTTLAAVVDILNRERAIHIVTVEDPVEFVHPRKRAMMSQREVGTHTRSFQSALKASLREDPDVIVVGELRDAETVRMALSASETGHLVIGTMNTPSASRTIDRLIDLFPPADQQQVRVTLAAGLRLVVSQRLVPTADGSGLAAAAELLPGVPALGALIRDAKTFQIPSLQQRGKGLGIVRLDDSLADLARAGRVNLAAALEVAEAPGDLEAQVTGRRAPSVVTVPAPPSAPLLEQAGKSLLGRAGAFFGKKGS